MDLANCATDTRGGRAPTPRSSRGGRGGRQAASSTLGPDRSFDNESHIFGEAGIESSVISSSELGGIPEVPEPPVQPVANRRLTKQERERQEQEEVLREIARTTVAGRARVQATAAADSFSRIVSQSGDKALDLLSTLISWFRR